jgi:cysteine-rich repeat protein
MLHPLHHPSPPSPHRRRHPSAGAIAFVGLALTVSLGLPAPGPALAHLQRVGISAKALTLRVAGNEAKRKFSYKSADAAITTAIVNPIDQGAGLLLLGGGGGRSAHVSLDPGKWKASRGGTVYKYADKTGSRGGVKRIVLKPGSLVIKASGKGLQWTGPTEMQAVWVLFRLEDEWLCAHTAGQTKKSGAYTAKASTADECPAPVCGDGAVETGEQCDDGDVDDGNACKNDCALQSTFDAIQRVVFDDPRYGCTTGPCHDGTLPAGDLDLTAGSSYAALLGGDGLGAASVNAVGAAPLRVFPGEPLRSFLWHKLARKTLPDEPLSTGGAYDEGGSPMPSGTEDIVLADHLEAIKIWIRNGAPRNTVVEGTAELLGAALGAPRPQTIPDPARPAAVAGLQLRQTPWPLPLLGEGEICMATYYDVSALVPADVKVACPREFQVVQRCDGDGPECSTDADCGGGACLVIKNKMNDTGECFAWSKQVLYQDPQSHHSLIHAYTGAFDATHPGWGAWTRKFQDRSRAEEGAPCDPTDIDPALGYNPNCSSAIVSAGGCIGFGPPDLTNFAGGGFLPTGDQPFSTNTPLFSGSQEPVYEQSLAPGVYTTLPTKGIVVWNSHAFNFTPFEATLSQYVNLFYERDRSFPSQRIFEASSIFVQDVPPFETREYCKTFTVPRGARLFQMSSHTHQWGVHFRVWGPPQTPCRPACPDTAGGLFGCDHDPALPLCGPAPIDPARLMYRSTEYTDPLQLEWFDSPIPFDQEDRTERTYLYCSIYDNGSTPSSPPVKRRSTTPPVPPILGIPGLAPGGPCSDAEVACLDGPNKGALCGGDDANCPASVCDACPVVGGLTTADEMFIFLGLYYLP